jgi:hypothetical protein
MGILFTYVVQKFALVGKEKNNDVFTSINLAILAVIKIKLNGGNQKEQ